MKQSYSKLNAVEEGLQDQPREDLLVLPVSESSRRPSIVKCVLTKQTKQTVLGVGWHFTPIGAKGGGIKIWKVKEDGIAADTAPELREGMKLLRINVADFQHCKSPNNVSSTLSNLDGDITIVAADDPSSFYATVSLDELKKCSPAMKSSQLGIEFASISKDGIVIKFIHSSSPFAQQWKGEKPVVGDTVLMINDLDCTQGDLTVGGLNTKLDEMLLATCSTMTIYFTKDETPVRPQMTNRVMSNGSSLSSPPPGIEVGGRWGSNVHFGERTAMASCICCLFCGCISATVVSCLSFDRRRVYTVDQNVYDATGLFIGTERHIQVEDGETHGRVDEGRMVVGLALASVAGLVSGLLYYCVANMQPEWYNETEAFRHYISV